jgi:hypothetical protein
MTVPVRRFEMGATGHHCVSFLAHRGYVIGTKQGHLFFVRGPSGGRPKRMTKAQLLALNDAERVKAGLEPIQKART